MVQTIQREFRSRGAKADGVVAESLESPIRPMRPALSCAYAQRGRIAFQQFSVAQLSQISAYLSNVKRSATGILKRLAIRSKVSNEGAFLPRSMRLRKSTEIPSVSAKRS